MVKVKKVMFACMVYIIGGHLWLQYSKNDNNVDIRLHAQAWHQVSTKWSKVGIMTVFWPTTKFPLWFIYNKYLII